MIENLNGISKIRLRKLYMFFKRYVLDQHEDCDSVKAYNEYIKDKNIKNTYDNFFSFINGYTLSRVLSGVEDLKNLKKKGAIHMRLSFTETDFAAHYKYEYFEF